MSRVLLVNLASLPMDGNQPIFPIGVRCIQDALDRAGHVTRLVDFVEEPNSLVDLEWLYHEWDVIGFTIRNIDPIDITCSTHVDEYIAFAERIRMELGRRGLDPVLVGGGPGFSLFGNTLVGKLGLDVGVIGPGEQVMLDIAADPKPFKGRGDVLQGRRHCGFLTDTLRHPSSLMAAYSNAYQAMIGVETRRKTCYQTCAYCPYAHIDGDNTGDLKPIDVLAEEIRGIHDQGFRRIFFTDGIFNSELRYAKDVVELVRELALDGLTWSAYFTPKPFDDHFGELLQGSGVEAVVVSPDSLDDSVMRNLGKSFTTRHVSRFLDRSRKNDLPIKVNVVFGGPGETRESVRNSAGFINANLEDDELVMHVGYRVLPETALARHLGMETDRLLYPTFYPFDLNVFSWVIQDLDSRFVSPELMMNLMAGRASARKMARVEDATRTIAPPPGMTYLALASKGGDNDCCSQ
ncbi:B12-binding domain-containing radical SAM protein [Streptomyces sp. NPDC086787]|uniref:B12-binding domain-containing radical SAM protein n=1 Tax=Streptomyces sp. NPDC086787 TaxID=3365759 RepID=UPI0038221CE1